MSLEIVSTSRLPEDDLLTLRDVAKHLQWSEEKLRPYVDLAGFKQWVEARPKPRSKGVGYPVSSLPKFERLKADVEANKVTPKTLAGWLSDTIVQSPRTPETVNVLSERLPELLSVLLEIAEAGKRYDHTVRLLTEATEKQTKALPPPTDKLLSMKQAHEETGLPYAILKGIRVKVGNRLYVRRLDALRTVQEAKKA